MGANSHGGLGGRGGTGRRLRRDTRSCCVLVPWGVPAAAPAAGTAAAARPQPARRSYDYRQFVVRAANPEAAIPMVKAQIWAVDPNQPVERVALVKDTYAEMFGRQRFVLLLMGAFAIVALVLTAAGIFGVLSQASRSVRRDWHRMEPVRAGRRLQLVISAAWPYAIGSLLGVPARSVL